LGDCFFSLDSGVDWWNLLGAKSEPAVLLAVRSMILNTTGVTGLIEISVNLNQNRNITVKYSVTTVYGNLGDVFSYSLV
jgi:hypothetical protein